MISVVIPAYNEEKYLGKTLQSLVLQETKYSFEVVVVDNASTDRTADVAESFSSQLNHLRVIRESKKGRGQARATGMDASRGRIILCTDADAVLPPNWVEKMVDALEANPAAVAVSSAGKIVDFDPITNALYWLGDLFYMYSYRIFLGYNTIVGFSLAVRAQAYQRSGGFRLDLRAQEDLELGIRLRKEGQILFLPRVTVLVSGRRFRGGMIQGVWQYLRTTFEFFVLKKSGIDLDDVR